MKKNILLVFACSFLLTQAMAHVNLLNPTGGESFEVGETVTIEWQIAISHNIQNWDLSVSIDNGSTWEAVELNIPPTGSAVGTLVSYDWIIPNTPSNQVKLLIVMDNSGTDYDDTSAAFEIRSSLGLSENWSQSEISLFPNPVHNGAPLQISFPADGNDISSIQIFNSEGASVKSIQIAEGNLSEVKKMDLNGLKPGIYFLVLMSNKSAIQRKSFVVL